MVLKWIFDRAVAFLGLLFLWPILLIVAIMVKIKMPGGPAFFVQKRVGKNGKLFNCHKFRTMTVNHNGSTVSVAGDSRITPFGALLGMVVAFGVSIAAIKFLMGYIKKHDFKVFGWYRIALGVVVLAYFLLA